MSGDLGTAALLRLTAVSRAVGDERGLDEVLELAVRCATSLLGERCAVLLLRDESGAGRVRAGSGLLSGEAERFAARLDESLPRQLHRVMGAFEEADLLAAPVVVEGRIEGVLAVVASSRRAEGEALLSALADQVSVAVEACRGAARRQELEKDLAQARRDGEGGQQALEQLGHDLRTPLHAVRGYCEILTTGVLGPLAERQREVLDRVQEVLRHTVAVVDQVLEIAALAGEESAPGREPFAVAEVAEQAAALVRGTPRGRHLDLRVETPFEPWALGDPHRLRRVLVQLLDNAVKYAGDDGPVVVRTVAGDDSGWASIEVADHGPGLPAEALGVTFRSYQRFLAESGRQIAGTGLGLAIAQRVVEAMGGRLKAANAATGGAVFRITLPAAPPQA